MNTHRSARRKIGNIMMVLITVSVIFFLIIGSQILIKSTSFNKLVHPNKELETNYLFPISENSFIPNLASQQIAAYIDTDVISSRKERMELYPSSNGTYVLGKGYPGGITSTKRAVYEYIARFDKEGKLQWYRHYHGKSNSGGLGTEIGSIAIDEKDSIYITFYLPYDNYGFRDPFFFGRYVPSKRRGGVISFSKEGKLRWVQFLKTPKNNVSSLKIHHGKLLMITSSEDNQLNFFHLDPDQGRVLYHKAATMTGEASTFNVSDDLVFIPEFERDDMQKNTFLFRRQGFTLEGELLWSLEDPISFPLDTTIYTINKNCIFVQSNANHMYVAGTFLATPDSYFLRSSHPPQQFAFLYALKPDGMIAWNYTSSVEDDACFTGLQCDMEQIYLMGSSTTNFLPKTATAFQSEPAGGSDYFLWAMDLNGQTRWATFIGGSKDEAIPEDSVLYPREISRRALLRLQGNALILAGSTQSQDYPIKNSLPRSFASQEESQENEKPCYGVLSVFSTQGQLQWSTYLHQEATEEQMQETPPSSITLKKIPDNEIILSLEYWDQKVYVVSVSSNPYTLLYNPHQRSLFFKEDEKTLEYVIKDPRSFYFLSIVDLE